MAKTAQVTCKFLGVLFFVAGLAGFAFGEEADWYHNLLHFLTGLIALHFGFCLVFGVGYQAFGMLGIALGDQAMNRLWDVGLARLSLGDHVFHVVLGMIILAGGLFSRDVTVPTFNRVEGDA
jgi:hypothetical protein